jgi:hypothetical protein
MRLDDDPRLLPSPWPKRETLPTAGSERMVGSSGPSVQQGKTAVVKWTAQQEKPDHFWPGSLVFDVSARGQSTRKAEDCYSISISQRPEPRPS